MEKEQFYERMRSEVQEFTCSGRDDSVSFLIWYLYNFFRLDKELAIESVCDHKNDKGIDGICVDDDSEEIYLFQSKYSPFNDQDQGERDLRSFVGAKQWFVDSESVNALLDVNCIASKELKRLVETLNLREKIALGFSLRLQFITNKIFDASGKEFLELNAEFLEGIDALALLQKYTYIADKEIQTERKVLKLDNNSSINYNLPSGTEVRVYSIQAKELLKLDGIQDKTLFSKNVRYGLGKTRVNNEIAKTLKNQEEHSNFFLYHNGITIITEALEKQGEHEIVLQNYSIINGCQSILTLYENRDKLSNRISLPVKIIKLDPLSPLIHNITFFANNQNSISLKDLKSDDRIQKALKNEFKEIFDNKILYKIKRGESDVGYEEVVQLDFAAQLIESFYLCSPQNAHLKNSLFGERYSKIFSREITADKIYLAFIIYNIIEQHVADLQNEQVKTYGLSKLFFCHLIGEILRLEDIGQSVLSNPRNYVVNKKEQMRESITLLWKLLVPEIDAYIEQYTEQNGGFFDYKNVFKNAEFVKAMTRQIKSDHQRILVRHPEDSFESILNANISRRA